MVYPFTTAFGRSIYIVYSYLVNNTTSLEVFDLKIPQLR